METLKDSSLVILAAGSSTRLGEPKGLVRIHGRPWLELQLESFARAGGGGAVVVLGDHLPQYRQELSWLESGFFGSLRVEQLHNPRPEAGPFPSLQIALRHLLKWNRSSSFFVTPVDCPMQEAPWSEMRKSLTTGVLAVRPRISAARTGHPILISARFARELVLLDSSNDESRLDFQLKKIGSGKVAEVPVYSPAAGLNLNTREDWNAFTSSSFRHSSNPGPPPASGDPQA